VILLGDFNSRTRSLQNPLHDQSDDMFCIQEIDPKSVGLHRMSNNALGLLKTYGRHPLHLGKSQELLILNGLPGFSNSRFFTCWPHGGGASVVDYVLSSHNLLPFIHHFYVSPIHLADHALLSFFLRADTPLPPGPTRHYLLLRQGGPEHLFYPLPTDAPIRDPVLLTDFSSTKYNYLTSTIWDATLKSYPDSTWSTFTSLKHNSCPMN
jgi:hypothetical protein